MTTSAHYRCACGCEFELDEAIQDYLPGEGVLSLCINCGGEDLEVISDEEPEEMF